MPQPAANASYATRTDHPTRAGHVARTDYVKRAASFQSASSAAAAALARASPARDDDNTYRPRSVLLTGGAGFIGSYVAEALAEMFPDMERLVVYDIFDYCGNEWYLDEVKRTLGGGDGDGDGRLKVVRGDVRSADLLRHVFETERIDTVLHLAAQSHVDNSFGSPLMFNNVNSVGTHTMLVVAKEFHERGQLRRFVHMSTDEVMGESPQTGDQGEDVSFDETALLNPTNPYAASKAAAEMFCFSYHKSYGLPIIIVRSNNVYGGRQYPEKLIPKMICMLRAGAKKLPVHGDGQQCRSFMCVTDTASALMQILMHGHTGHVYNVATEFEVSNLEVVHKILALFGIPETERDDYIEHVRDRHFNDRRYNADCRKLRELTGWHPTVDFDEGLARTVEWYKQHAHRYGDLSRTLVAHPTYQGKQA